MWNAKWGYIIYLSETSVYFIIMKQFHTEATFLILPIVLTFLNWTIRFCLVTCKPEYSVYHQL